MRVEASGSRRWIQRIMINPERFNIGLGLAKLVSLIEAREKALENKKLARCGVNPLATGQIQKTILSFE